MILRPDQYALVERVRDAYRSGARSVCMQAATGFGKTTTAADIIARAVARERRVVFAAHLDALIDDTSERLERAGIAHGIVQSNRPTNPAAPVQVCSLATLHRRGERPPADLVVVDECHRTMAATVREVLEAYPTARLLGLTATPERGDGAPLGDVFESLICGPSVAELTRAGLLAPAVVYSPPAPLGGGLAMDPVEAYSRFARALPAMVFCRDADHAVDVCNRLEAVAIPATLILGNTPRAARRQARQRLAASEPLVLVGCGVFVEGWDSPEVRAVVLARAFGVCSAYLQACGRGLRTAAGKTDATIVDLSGAAIVHGLPTDGRIWSLEGDAVRRTAEALAPLARCQRCLAVFHAGAAECPRCGGSTRGARLPRRATRIERAELARLDTRPQYERDAMAIRGIESRLRRSGRFSEKQLPHVALSMFIRVHKRSPESAA
jgi:DNA repair protein RadD